MHPFSIVTLAIFVAGYITARWDLVTRLYELAIFAVDHGVLVGTFSYSNFVVKLIINHRLAQLKELPFFLSFSSSS